MDLDFSFALVSSLTPRGKAEKSRIAEIQKKTNSLKTKLNLPLKSQNSEEISLKKREEKENLLPTVQLMNNDEFLKPKENKRNSISSKIPHERQSNNHMSSFSINMENIAVRRNQRGRRKKVDISPLQPRDNVPQSNDDRLIGKPDLPSEIVSLSATEIVNISSDIDDKYEKIQSNKHTYTNVKGKSCSKRVSDSSVRSSLEIVESSYSEAKRDSYDNEKDNGRRLRSLCTKKPSVKTQSTRISGVSETSLSTAYDSDSFHAIRRHGATKVIPETPETDKSSACEKRKSSILSISSQEYKETLRLSSSSNETPAKNLRSKRKSSEISNSPDENKKRFSIESSISGSRRKRKPLVSSEQNKKVADEFDFCSENNNTDGNNMVPNKPSKSINQCKTKKELKKKLRTSNEPNEVDMFKLESSLKSHSLQSKITQEFSSRNLKSTVSCSNNEQQGRTGLPESKDLKKERRIKGKETNTMCKSKPTLDDSEMKLQGSKKKHCSPTSPKMSTLILPSEVIPKFEHINRWLKETQEINVGSLNSEYPVIPNGISVKDLMPVIKGHRVSLSPRIKKKKEKAKTSLEEEQKLFEELYGADKRLSGDEDEVISGTSEDSVEFSENVLDKLYETVWQKNPLVSKSEPRKGKKKNPKKIAPLTDRKKHRTSIYEVFSSSSSEDRFEEFLENVQRGKVESTKRRSGRPKTPEFINDSGSEDNESLIFYQNIISSAVKESVNDLRKEETTSEKDKVNRRRLSFGSSKDGCSESGKPETKPKTKSTNSLNDDHKTKTKKSRSKKKANKYIEHKDSDDIGGFSLVTPLKIKGKKTESDSDEKFTNPIASELPRSIGKTKTPKNPSRGNNLNNSEERLKASYLKEGDFKAPRSASKAFQTPSKTVKPVVPASPALSFLSSLSEQTAGLPCHPDALAYKKSFKTKREELSKRLFTLYNKEVFDNQLPADMLIEWNTRMTSTSGYCYNKRIYRGDQVLRSSRIVLSTKILDRADRLRDTLIHELCHAATWIFNATSDGHGPIWRSWADKANRRFPELPVIKRCHDYAISTKFTYKCMSCGYSIGRHTKSLDTERKRCGYCFGKFQVFVTAKMSSASVTSGSDSVKTPRNPTGFALFVKENYAIVKKENNVPHAQVMKLLSQKFAEVKISKQNAVEPILIE